MSNSLANKLDKIILILIKGIIFLLPLFFLPWTNEYFEFNKQFLLWLFASIASLLWLGQAAVAGRIKIKINFLNLPILIFLLLAAAAAWFSLDRFSSYFGYFGRFSDAWFGLLSLAILYFLIINTKAADSAEKIFALLKLLLYASFIAAVVSFSAMLGWLGALSGDPTSIFSAGSFNPAGGSLLSLAVFLAIMSLISANFLVRPAPVSEPGLSRGLKKFERIFFGAGLIIFLLVLALIDFSLSWVLVLLGAGLMIFFRLPARRSLGAGGLASDLNFKKIINFRLLAPLAIMLLAVLVLILPNFSLAKMVLGQELPKEALLGYSQSWAITQQVLKNYPFLGSGPGTFAQDFSLYRPAEFNASVFWQIRFDKSGSHFLEILATAGLLTWLSYLLIICLIIYLNIVLIRKYLKSRPAGPANDDYNLITALFTVFILIFFAQFFFLTNTVLNFIFWLISGLLIAFWQRTDNALFKERIINLRQTGLFYRLSLLSILALAAAGFMLLAFQVKFFAADLIAASGQGQEAKLTAAIKLNPHRYNYRISLAKFYLNQARAEAFKPLEQKNNNRIQTNISQAVEAARQALAIAPNSVLAQETLGLIYRDIRPLTIGSEPWAVKYFSGALELEPTNPVLAAELAKAYLNNNDLIGAENYFRKALELKRDYYEAKFGLAKTYLKNRQDNQALILLNELAREVQSAEVYYEQGRIYYNHGEIDQAIDRFKLTLSLAPRQANSLYSLALAYEAKGENQEALKYYRQVLELDKSNAEVRNKIEELNK